MPLITENRQEHSWVGLLNLIKKKYNSPSLITEKFTDTLSKFIVIGVGVLNRTCNLVDNWFCKLFSSCSSVLENEAFIKLAILVFKKLIEVISALGLLIVTALFYFSSKNIHKWVSQQRISSMFAFKCSRV